MYKPGFLGAKYTKAWSKKFASFKNCLFLLEHENKIAKLVTVNALFEEFLNGPQLFLKLNSNEHNIFIYDCFATQWTNRNQFFF